MSDRTHALLSPPVPALTPAEDDAVTLAALLDMLAETGCSVRVCTGWPSGERHVVAVADTQQVIATGTTVPHLLQMVRQVQQVRDGNAAALP